MQARSPSSSRKASVSPRFTSAGAGSGAENFPEESSSSGSAGSTAKSTTKHGERSSRRRERLFERRGRLAIRAAAMLGLIVYYKWGEKTLAQEDPEEYQRLQRIKNRVRHADDPGSDGDRRR